MSRTSSCSTSLLLGIVTFFLNNDGHHFQIVVSALSTSLRRPMLRKRTPSSHRLPRKTIETCINSQARSQQAWLRMTIHDVKSPEFLEAELVQSSTSNILGQPYKFDLELINYGTVTISPSIEASNALSFLEEDEEKDRLINEEAVETEKIRIEEVGSELAWSILSNRCFMLGASSQLISSTWDFFGAPDVLHHSLANWNTMYIIIASMSPFVYLLNSAIDVKWAEHSSSCKGMPNNDSKTTTDQYSVHPNKETPNSYDDDDYRPATDDEVQYYLPEQQMVRMHTRRIKTFSPKRPLVKVAKYSAHRHEYFAATAFGVAALFGVVDLGLQFSGLYSHTMIPGSDRAFFDSWSVHTYLLSAIFAVTRSRHRPWNFSWLETPDILEDIGDVLFLVGSFIDVLLCDLHFDDDTPLWPAFSAFLWFLDACFYVRSDLVTRTAYNDMSLSEQWVLPFISRQIVETALMTDEKHAYEYERVLIHRSYL